MKWVIQNWNIISLLVIPAVGWIMKRVGGIIPESWAKFVTALTPEELDALVLAMGTSYGREAYVRALVKAQAEKYGLQFTDAQISTILDWLKKLWDKKIKHAEQKV